ERETQMNAAVARHVIYQASAGTGKNHTIEEMMRGVLCAGPPLALKNILVLTYTEKAAGGLGGRLRAMPYKAWAGADPVRHRAARQGALDEFDQATIATIPSFCQRVLLDFPLEQGHDFTAELVDDGELRGPALREVQRRHWRDWLGDCLAEAIGQVGYDQ